MRQKTFTKKQAGEILSERCQRLAKKYFGVRVPPSLSDAIAQRNYTEAGLFVALFQKLASGLDREAKGKRKISEAELEEFLARTEAQLAERMPELKKATKEALKNFRRVGGPGRKDALDGSQRLEAIKLVSATIEANRIQKLEDIFASVAKSFEGRRGPDGTPIKVSARTIRRYWDKRGSAHAS